MATNGVFCGLPESAPDAVVSIDIARIIQIVNRQTENRFGYPRSAPIGEPLEMLLPERLRGKRFLHRARSGADLRIQPRDHNLNLGARFGVAGHAWRS